MSHDSKAVQEAEWGRMYDLITVSHFGHQVAAEFAERG
jgi:hypothetical protein